MEWTLNRLSKTKFIKPILIEGLPGLGNVGKIAVDFMIENTGAKKIAEFQSYNFPHCVFVNEDNLIELPEIEVYHKKIKGNDLLFLAGDIQPLDERSCYEFCHLILDNFQKEKGQEIITIGGIALPKIPEIPKVYCTGNDKKMIDRYASKNHVETNIHGVVGPIIGVSGLLPGLAGKRNIPAISLLAETFAHPNYMGVKGAKEVLKVLNEKFSLKLNLNELENEIKELEQGMKNFRKIKKIVKKKKPSFSIAHKDPSEDTSYIG
jgi:uncharacterized protein